MVDPSAIGPFRDGDGHRFRFNDRPLIAAQLDQDLGE